MVPRCPGVQHPGDKAASKGIYSRREGILAWYDKSINNGFAEAINNTQTTCKMIREFRNIDYFIIMVYLCNSSAGDLPQLR